MTEYTTIGPVDPEQQDESQQPCDDWSPSGNDAAFEAGYHFVELNRNRADQYAGNAPMWFGWMVRQGFWEGVKFARAEQQAEIEQLREELERKQRQFDELERAYAKQYAEIDRLRAELAIERLQHATPWEYLANEKRDGVWADYAAWETWLIAQLPDEAQEGYKNAENDGCWKENLYMVMTKAAGRQKEKL